MKEHEVHHLDWHEDRHQDQNEPRFYRIRVNGHLDDRRAGWFGGLTITRQDNGDTVLAGRVVDQAALHGLLRKVRDLGMPLISVTLVRSDQAAQADTKYVEQGAEASCLDNVPGKESGL